MSDFAALKERVVRAGLLHRAPVWYRRRIALDLSLVAAAWALVFVADGPAMQAVAAIALAVTFSQIGLLAHDAAHHQILDSARANQVLALFLFDGVVGLSLEWWRDKHQRHHLHPNRAGADPDAVPFTQRWILRRQAVLFFPLLLFEGFHLRQESFRVFLRGACRHPRAEALALAVHFTGYVGLLVWRLGAGGALFFITVHHVAMGVYLGLVFAPNHMGMPIIEHDVDLDFVRAQVLTTRNVRPGRVVDYLFGGLNYQIEHHLFPSMPRPHLRRARRIVRSFCRERDIPYRETRPLGAYAEVLGSLHRAGAPFR